MWQEASRSLLLLSLVPCCRGPGRHCLHPFLSQHFLPRSLVAWLPTLVDRDAAAVAAEDAAVVAGLVAASAEGPAQEHSFGEAVASW